MRPLGAARAPDELETREAEAGMRNGHGEADLGAQRRDHEGSRVEHGAGAKRAPLTLVPVNTGETSKQVLACLHVLQYLCEKHGFRTGPGPGVDPGYKYKSLGTSTIWRL